MRGDECSAVAGTVSNCFTRASDLRTLRHAMDPTAPIIGAMDPVPLQPLAQTHGVHEVRCAGGETLLSGTLSDPEVRMSSTARDAP